ncbi:uncharacterized protein LOC113272430 [Papaver somniferum]|uniref:uncharacterized protein LOC113272430 n=1 Tax=Papaver somniferum TaxID=3469 RepID=UPI000E6F7C1F|nr:uncharacterized protein LOC113272430 [Papaver somniferum]
MERLERDHAMEFLQGLHDRFSNLRSQILTMEPFPIALRIFNLVQQEEKQQHITVNPMPTVDSAALNTNRHFPSSSRPPASQNKRQRPHCDFCNKHGHVRDKCYKLHGFPTPTNNLPVAAATAMPPDSTAIQPAIPSLSADQYARLLVLITPLAESAQMKHRANFAGTILIASFLDPWFVDSGATHHICNSLQFFTSYKPVNSLIQMQLPDGSFSVVKHIGEVDFSPTLKLSNGRVTQKVIDQANFISGLYHLQIHQQQQVSHKSDNGTEFLSRDIQNWFADRGIHHQRIFVSIPQQKGVVERKHRHLLNMARALRFQANFPITYWGECILTAAYLINKMPTPILSHKTPHEILLGKSPNYRHLRVFGCLCFARNTNISSKFDPRAIPGVFLGYPYNHKGYIILNLETQTTFVSRDLVFHKHRFSFKDAKLQNTDFLQSSLQKEAYIDDSPASMHVTVTQDSIKYSSTPIQIPYDHQQEASVSIRKTIADTPTPAVSSSSGTSPITSSTDVDSPVTTVHSESEPSVRRSTRECRRPSHLQDYICSVQQRTSNSPYPLTNYISFDKFTP